MGIPSLFREQVLLARLAKKSQRQVHDVKILNLQKNKFERKNGSQSGAGSQLNFKEPAL